MVPNQLEWDIGQELAEFVRTDGGNALAAFGGMRIYQEPLLAVASAEDPWFDRFTEPGILGPTFLKPQEWLAGGRSVLSYFLPFTRPVRDSNRGAGLPSEVWVSARIDGEAFNEAARTFLMGALVRRGAQACAPTQDPRFRVEARVANWSERHAAFVAGLGTFGLHRALITAKGTTGRIGSVITTLALPPTPRPYVRFDEYCPFLTQGKCGACMRRCPPSAISPAGKDHRICSDYIDREVLARFRPRYGCAKCNLSVPCEAGIPRGFGQGE
jgi:epoxyqueuosine reductase QueG